MDKPVFEVVKSRFGYSELIDRMNQWQKDHTDRKIIDWEPSTATENANGVGGETEYAIIFQHVASY